MFILSFGTENLNHQKRHFNADMNILSIIILDTTPKEIRFHRVHHYYYDFFNKHNGDRFMYLD